MIVITRYDRIRENLYISMPSSFYDTILLSLQQSYPITNHTIMQQQQAKPIKTKLKTPGIILLDIPHPIIAFSQVKRLTGNGIPIIPPGHSKSIAHTLRTAALTTVRA